MEINSTRISFFNRIHRNDVGFLYDLQSFFADHAYLNQSKIAELSGINSGLLRQYTSGVKHPSATQALKIQKVIHRLAKELGAVNFYV